MNLSEESSAATEQGLQEDCALSPPSSNTTTKDATTVNDKASCEREETLDLSSHDSLEGCMNDTVVVEALLPSQDDESNTASHRVDFSDDIGKIGNGFMGVLLSPIPHSEDGLSSSAQSPFSPESSAPVQPSEDSVTALPVVSSPMASVSSLEQSPVVQSSTPTTTSSPQILLPLEEDQGNTDDDDKVNDSMTSSGSLGEEEMIRAKEEVGASSLAFIERLRGAAFRRKLNLTRSRDSLAVKERQQREEIAASKALQAQRRVSEPPPSTLQPAAPADPNAAVGLFKALPLPASTGLKGHGGLSGVPKVGKKPSTTPFSPMLGARRQMRRLLGQDVDERPKSSATTASSSTGGDSNAFRARLLPPTTGQFGHAGQVGVPKVPKRPVTVPMSPLLGARRTLQPEPNSSNTSTNHAQHRQSDGSLLSASVEPTSMSASGNSALFGLDLLKGIGWKENTAPSAVSTATPKSNAVLPAGYQPHSTVRAKQRADFEAQRVLNEQIRLEKESTLRKLQVVALQKELRKLRTSL